MAPSAFVTAHYYIDAIPRAAVCAAVHEARAFLRQSYDDPELGSIALEIGVTAEAGDLSWKNALDRMLEDRDYLSWRVERDALPKCVIAGYREEGRPVVRAFMTVAEALEFFPVNGEIGRHIDVAKLRVYLTASDVLRIVPPHVSFPGAWDLALDIVLNASVVAANRGDAVMRGPGKHGAHLPQQQLVDPTVAIAAE